jgi:hypothetical protein
MPRKRDGLATVKTRLEKELKQRTDKRIRDLLQPTPTFQEPEVSDDSEEENRLLGRRARPHRHTETVSEEENRLLGRRARPHRHTVTISNCPSSSFCCGVIVGVLLCVSLLFLLVLLIGNGRHK